MIAIRKTTKKREAVEVIKFNSDEIELFDEAIKKITPSFQKLSNYEITSTDFDELVRYFKMNYNPNFFNVDTITHIITLNTLKIGEKRKLAVNKPLLTREKRFEKLIKKWGKENDFFYDKRKGVIEVMTSSFDTIVISIDEKLKVSDIKINGYSLNDIEKAVEFANKYSKKINQLK